MSLMNHQEREKEVEEQLKEYPSDVISRVKEDLEKRVPSWTRRDLLNAVIIEVKRRKREAEGRRAW